MEELTIKNKQLMLIETLFFNDRMTVKQMKFILHGNLYKLLHDLVENGFISPFYVKNSSRSGYKYVKAYELTEKGRNYIEQIIWKRPKY